MEEKKLFIKEVMPNIFLMDEAHEATGYLVVGNERACVIDTMNGYNDLYQAVRELTDKPLTVVNTHGHPDHIFGNMFFQEAYLHPADRELARMFVEDPEYQKMLEERKTTWFTVYKANRLKPTTTGGYRTMLNTHLYPTWGDTPLNEITTKAIQEFLNGRSDRSRKTLQELLTLLKAILESARKDRLIEFNPADDRRLRIPSDKKTERKALSMEDEKDILANISKLQKQDQRFLALLIYTGMRRGEILGLMWDDIDLEENVIHVRRNVTYPSGQNDPVIGTTKTRSGVRDIPIIPDLPKYITPFGKGQFVMGEGKNPVTMSINRRRMERINRVINLHGATPHVFRHSFATMLNDSGASIKTIQSIIGQSDFKTTADRCCHARDSSKQKAVQDLNQLLTSN